MNSIISDKVSREIIPTFGREVYFGWLIESKYKDQKQRERYAAAIESYDHYKVETPGDLHAAIEAEKEEARWPGEVKTWPMLAFAAKKSKHTGGYRIWTLARALDPDGAGKVKRSELMDYLDHLGIYPRKRRRWIGDATTCGLIHEAGEYYYYSSLPKAAYFLGGERIGYAASIKAANLVQRNWSAKVWRGHLATLHGRPMSQEKKAEITGVSPKVQRNWQNGRSWETKSGKTTNKPIGGIERRKNYAKTYIKPAQVQGVRDEFGWNVFIGKSGIRQRLPDLYVISPKVSKTYGVSRSKKSQKYLNSLCCLAQRSESDFRLFHEAEEHIVKTQKRATKLGLADRDLFLLEAVRDDRNVWKTIPINDSVS